MKIIDINGCAISVTDLEAAIKQANEFRQYNTDDEDMKMLVLKQQAYWQDIYEKLLGLRVRRKKGKQRA